MKGIFKLIPAALAVFALASCSTDVIEGSKTQEQTIANKGDLRMTFDAFDDETPTRAMRDNNFGSLTFVDGDQVNVYSEDLYNTDWYKFDTDAFYYDENGPKMVTEPKFGVMPGDAVKKAYIDRENRETRVDIEIPEKITYNSDSEVAIDEDNSMYACNLPMFGYASFPEGEEYVAVSHVRYMVGILKIDLGKAIGNASWLRLINYGQGAIAHGAGGQFLHGSDQSDIAPTAKPLSGVLTAKLYADDALRTEVKLEKLDPTLATAPYLYVDLRSVPSNTSCIYLPVVPGLDGDVDNIRLEYSKERGDEPNDFEADKWVNIPGMSFPNITFAQHKRYKGKHSFAFEDMSPKLVSEMLEQYQSTGRDIDIDITKSFTIKDDEGGADEYNNTIYLPAFENDVNVNIHLTNAFTTWTNADKDVLNIVDLDPENPFTGTITINIDAEGGDIAADCANMVVDLAEGTAVIAGKFDHDASLTPNSGNIVIGDGTTVTEGITWAGIGKKVNSFTIAKNASAGNNISCIDPENETATIIVNGTLDAAISGGPLTTAITVGADGEVTGRIIGGAAKTDATKCLITVNGAVGDGIANAEGGIYTSLIIDGTVTGAIDLGDAVKGKLTITSGDATDPDFKAVTGNVTMKGDVEIAMKAEGEAITGRLLMTGAAKTLTLKQGYVNTIAANSKNAGSWEEKYINVVLDQPLEVKNGVNVYGKTAFLVLDEIEEDGHPSIAKFTKSIWDGEAATNATYVNTFTAAYGTSRNIFTATQLARTWTYASDAKLANNIDLNNKVWTGITKSANFTGKKVVEKDKDEEEYAYPTISNLNLSSGGGLFAEIDDAAEISHVKFNGVTASFTADKSGVGTICGKISAGDVTISDVTVTGLSLVSAADKKAENIGGLVGLVSGGTLTTVATEDEPLSVAGTITGYSALGGFVGKAMGNVTIAGTATVAVSSNFVSGLDLDMKYARIGGLIGTLANNANATIAAGATATAPTHNFTAKEYISDTGAANGTLYNFKTTGLQTLIGFSGTTQLTGKDADNAKAFGTVKIGTTTQVEPTFGTANGGLVAGQAAIYYFDKKN